MFAAKWFGKVKGLSIYFLIRKKFTDSFATVDFPQTLRPLKNISEHF